MMVTSKRAGDEVLVIAAMADSMMALEEDDILRMVLPRWLKTPCWVKLMRKLFEYYHFICCSVQIPTPKLPVGILHLLREVNVPCSNT